MSAEAAMQIVRAVGVDVIVTDVMLAGNVRDGLWLLRQVADLKIPVIALTGLVERHQEFLRAGFAAVHAKPVNIDVLVDAVKAALKQP